MISSASIHPSLKFPRYWHFRGRPVLLLGGSVTDSLFQLPPEQLIPHLDEMVEVGANVVRCTMSDRSEGALRACLPNKDGLYDLARMNPAYWERLAGFLRATCYPIPPAAASTVPGPASG
jgi:hypothetical protein